MNNTVRQAIKTLRDQGYAVITFSPDEVGDADPRDLEGTLIAQGNEWLMANSPDQEEE